MSVVVVVVVVVDSWLAKRCSNISLHLCRVITGQSAM